MTYTPRSSGSTIRRLSSGILVEVFGNNPVKFVTCSWLIEVATGNPEPDFPSDAYRVEECGARVTSLDGKAVGRVPGARSVPRGKIRKA